jgi:hypothetical protein
MKRVTTHDPRIDPPATQPWLDRSMTAEELGALHSRLSTMTQADLVKFYYTELRTCRPNHSEPLRAPFTQQMVQAWREMQGRRKAKLAPTERD